MNHRFARTIVLILLFAGSFVACKNKANKTTGATTKEHTAILLDSASLIHDLAYLSSEALAGRESATPGNKLALEHIVKRYDSLQLAAPDSGRLQPFMLEKKSAKQGTNAIAMIKGSQYPDQYFVLSAHFDHLGTKNGKIYYGADDNASGSACLLAFARYFKQHPPKHSIIFASFDAEEKGLLGAYHFVAHPPVAINKIVLNVNMDMVSRNDKNEIYVAGIYYYPFLKKYVDSVSKLTTVQVMQGHDNPSLGSDDWTSQSDHFPFHKAKIPFLYFGVEDHPDYHKPTDTFEKVDKSFYFKVCNMIGAAIVLLDKEEKLQ